MEDGSVCFDYKAVGPNFPLMAIPYSIGVLLAPYINRPDRLRYGDLGLWTGDLLPMPASCPSFPEFQVCGPTCGGCPAGQQCVGRAPLHPYGFCVVKFADYCSRDGTRKCKNAGEGCFVYKVEAEAQMLADLHGLCIPLTRCNALASKLQGGGFCVPP
jgi:hypothetical protein